MAVTKCSENEKNVFMSAKRHPPFVAGRNRKVNGASTGEALGFLIGAILVAIWYFFLGGKADSDQFKKEIYDSEMVCKNDYDCMAEKKTYYASLKCKDSIEKLSKYSYEWTNTIIENKFSKYIWRDQSKGYITYLGDNIRFQNMYGAMENYVYECDMIIDPNSDFPQLQSVRVRPGRL